MTMVSPQVSTYFEVTGTLQQYPALELLSEISAAGLSGSARLENGQNKVICYFNEGKLVYAASNAREHRLFDILLRSGLLTKEQITSCKDIANDHLLAAQLEEKKLFDKTALTHVFGQQLDDIVKFIIGWSSGEWTFNALARIKEEVWQKFDLAKVLIENSKNLSNAELAAKFRHSTEVFSFNEKSTADERLTSQDYFILSRLDRPVNINDLGILTGLPEEEIAAVLYTLWIAGFVKRNNRQAAFTPEKIGELLSAEIKLKEKPKKAETAPQPAVAVPATETAEESAKDGEVTLEQYLDQIEKAETFYDVLKVYQDSDLALIKTNYFSFAKKFHPDKFHTESGSKIHQRVQHAFTQLSQAYDTLKDPEAREVYNFKMRRELERLQNRKALLEEMEAKGESVDMSNEAGLRAMEQAREEFDYGFDYLMNDDLAAAVPFLARAVSLAPKQARYHAYYGKALSYLEKNRHQAEKEIVTAIKIEPQNTDYRIMLIEFYIGCNMPKRAEGELKKLLTKDPGNQDAKNMLESLQTK
jgi:DnaJ-domain-containing protein 1